MMLRLLCAFCASAPVLRVAGTFPQPKREVACSAQYECCDDNDGLLLMQKGVHISRTSESASSSGHKASGLIQKSTRLPASRRIQPEAQRIVGRKHAAQRSPHHDKDMSWSPVEAPGIPSAIDDFPEAFDWDASAQDHESYVPPPSKPKVDVSVDASATARAAAMEHELVKLNAFCVNRAKGSAYAMNVGARNVSGCAAFVKSKHGCGKYFDYGIVDGWCECVTPESGACRPNELLAYNVYRLKDGLPGLPLLAEPHKPAAKLLEGKYALGRQLPNATNATEDGPLVGMTKNAEGDLLIFFIALGANLAIVCICLACFSFCQTKHPMVYHNNALLHHGREVPFQPSKTFGGWVQDSLRVTTQEAIDFSGLDHAMLLEYTSMALKFFAIVGIPMNLFMAPLHIFVGGGAAKDDRLSWQGMANVTEDNFFIFWIHCLIVWAVVLLSQRLIYTSMDNFMAYRREWIKTLPEPRCNSVMVESLPEVLRRDDNLKDYFDKKFGRKVVKEVCIVKHTKYLRELTNLMDHYLQDMNNAVRYMHDQGKRLELKSYKDEPVDGITYYQDMLEHTCRKIEIERANVKNRASGPQSAEVCSASGFVTFHSVQDATAALQLNYLSDGEVFVPTFPPDPADVMYTDLMVENGGFQAFMGYFLIVLTVLLLLPVVGVIAYTANLKTLGDQFTPVSDLLKEKPWVGNVWNALVSPLGLTLAMGLLPTILGFIFNGWFVMRARTFLQYSLQKWCFAFFIFFVMFVTSMGTALMDAAKDILESPVAFCRVFAATMPLVSHFYFNYIMLQWSSCAVEFARWPNLLTFIGYKMFTHEDIAKARAEPEDPDSHGMGARSASATLYFVIVLAFCQISPIISLLGLVLFGTMRLYYGYLFMFSEARKPQLGGAFWVTQLRHTQLGVFLYVILMTGVLFQRAPTSGPSMVAFASIVPMIYAFFFFDAHFKWEHMPVEAIVNHKDSERLHSHFHTYQQPELYEPLPDHSGHFPLPKKGGPMNDLAWGGSTLFGTHPTDPLYPTETTHRFDDRPNSFG